MPRLRSPVRAALSSVREAMGNDGLRRLELAWALGVAADSALLVVLLVTVYGRDGAVATGLLGAARMVPAVVSGMLSGAILARFRGNRVLLVIAVLRAASAALCGLVIATAGPTPLLFLFAAVGASAGAPVRPTQATLMPALARSPGELVAANMAWSTGEGLGAFAGPLAAGLLVAAHLATEAVILTAGTFLVTALVIGGLRFEQANDASGGGGPARGLRLADGLRTLRRRPVPGWSMLGVYGQVLTRGLLNSLVVVAAIELLGMGEGGVGLLNAAFGLGGLFGAALALSLTRVDRLVGTMCAALAWWGAPLAVIGLLPNRGVAIAAMAVIGLANATYDVAIFTIFQRGSANDERAPVFSVFEGVAGLGAVSGSLLGPLLLAAFGTRGGLAVGGAFLPIIALLIHARIGRADRITVLDEPTVDLLRSVPAFAEVPLTAIERLAAGSVRASFAAGTLLMRQGEPGDSFIVVAEGEIEVVVDGRTIQRLGPGSGVGEIALLRRSPRSATVRAVTDVTGLAIDGPTFLAAISGPTAAAVTERLVAANLARAAADS